MASKMFLDMQEVHYCQLESQSSIYGLAKFAVSANENKILVSSLRGKVLNVTFQKTAPSSREVTFTYIPGDAEIIAIDAFNRNSPVGVVIAIAFVKISEGKRTNYLNIYSEWETGEELDLDRIAQGCQSLDLSFVPYMIYHAEIFRDDCSDEQKETVLLMSGDDGQVHLFQEARNTHRFLEEQIEEHFPELIDLPGIVTWFHCVNDCNEKHRLTAVGCQNGFVVIKVVNLATKSVIKTYQVEHDSPISSVHLFTLKNQIPVPDISLLTPFAQAIDGNPVSLSDYHLLVTNTLELAVVFTNVVDRGLVDTLILPDSDAYDTVTCALVTDIDFDGTQEIILGTYGQELLVYKFQTRPPSNDLHDSTSQWSPSNDTDVSRLSLSSSCESSSYRTITCEGSRSSINATRSSTLDGEFVLAAKRSLPDPVLALDAVDMTGDGMTELIILSHAGLHVFQHNLQATAELCIRRLEKLFQTV